MITKIVELTNGINWGKFLVCHFDTEWARKSALPGGSGLDLSLLRVCGWGPEHLGVFDLATGEGAFFRVGPGASARADLEKHAIWVCPMFQPFLEWLNKHPMECDDIDKLPNVVMLTAAETRGQAALYGPRRKGPIFERIVSDLLEKQNETGRLVRGDIEAILGGAIDGEQDDRVEAPASETHAEA